jgi:hypothetical protein
MAIVIAIVSGLVALAYVLFPMLERLWEGDQQALPDSATSSAPLSIDEPEQAARVALQDVEFDFQLGNIAELDYRSLRERYMHTALIAMKSRQERDQELDEEIEERLRKMKENHEQKQP